MRSFIICNLLRNYQVKDDEMSGACSTNVEKRNAYRILVGKSEEKYHWEDQDVVEWTILK
jgi:hypothetical protein